MNRLTLAESETDPARRSVVLQGILDPSSTRQDLSSSRTPLMACQQGSIHQGSEATSLQEDFLGFSPTLIGRSFDESCYRCSPNERSRLSQTTRRRRAHIEPEIWR